MCVYIYIYIQGRPKVGVQYIVYSILIITVYLLFAHPIYMALICN